MLILLFRRYFVHELLRQRRHVDGTRVAVGLIHVAGVFSSHRIVRCHHLVACFILGGPIVLETLSDGLVELTMLLLGPVYLVESTLLALEWDVLLLAEF